MVLLVSSASPWAKRHLSPYLQVPFSRQFLHISYFNLRTTGGDVVVSYFFSPSVFVSDFLGSYESFDYDEEVALPKLDSAKGYLCILSGSGFCLT